MEEMAYASGKEISDEMKQDIIDKLGGIKDHDEFE
jgi:hypothetical protein